MKRVNFQIELSDDRPSGGNAAVGMVSPEDVSHPVVQHFRGVHDVASPTQLSIGAWVTTENQSSNKEYSNEHCATQHPTRHSSQSLISEVSCNSRDRQTHQSHNRHESQSSGQCLTQQSEADQVSVKSNPNERTLRSVETEKNDEKCDSVSAPPMQFTNLTSGQQSGRHNCRPGVILLGRGNSFSPVCSEVILLHNKSTGLPARQTVGKIRNMTSKNAIHLPNGDSNLRAGLEGNENLATSPPLSNGDLILPADTSCVGSVDNMLEGDSADSMLGIELEALWHKAESIMMGRCGAVQKVLEDFGISKAGGEGCEDCSGKEEEENVWHVVEEICPG